MRKKLVIFFSLILLMSMLFMPNFISAKAPDLNNDGKISFWEWFRGIFTGKVVGDTCTGGPGQGTCGDGEVCNNEGNVCVSFCGVDFPTFDLASGKCISCNALITCRLASCPNPDLEKLVATSDGCTCVSQTICPIEKICDDGIDNDNDTLVDCDDSDCSRDSACVTVPFCGNGICERGEDAVSCLQDCGGELPPPEVPGPICSVEIDNLEALFPGFSFSVEPGDFGGDPGIIDLKITIIETSNGKTVTIFVIDKSWACSEIEAAITKLLDPSSGPGFKEISNWHAMKNGDVIIFDNSNSLDFEYKQQLNGGKTTTVFSVTSLELIGSNERGNFRGINDAFYLLRAAQLEPTLQGLIPEVHQITFVKTESLGLDVTIENFKSIEMRFGPEVYNSINKEFGGVFEGAELIGGFAGSNSFRRLGERGIGTIGFDVDPSGSLVMRARDDLSIRAEMIIDQSAWNDPNTLYSPNHANALAALAVVVARGEQPFAEEGGTRKYNLAFGNKRLSLTFFGTSGPLLTTEWPGQVFERLIIKAGTPYFEATARAALSISTEKARRIDYRFGLESDLVTDVFDIETGMLLGSIRMPGGFMERSNSDRVSPRQLENLLKGPIQEAEKLWEELAYGADPTDPNILNSAEFRAADDITLFNVGGLSELLNPDNDIDAEALDGIMGKHARDISTYKGVIVAVDYLVEVNSVTLGRTGLNAKYTTGDGDVDPFDVENRLPEVEVNDENAALFVAGMGSSIKTLKDNDVIKALMMPGSAETQFFGLTGTLILRVNDKYFTERNEVELALGAAQNIKPIIRAGVSNMKVFSGSSVTTEYRRDADIVPLFTIKDEILREVFPDSGKQRIIREVSKSLGPITSIANELGLAHDLVTETTTLTLNRDSALIYEQTFTVKGRALTEAIAGDLDNDGVANFLDKCDNTIAETLPTEVLRPNHYFLDFVNKVFNTNFGSVASPDIGPSTITSVDAFGCNCEQILFCKPGANKGEFKYGCTQGTMNIWTKQTAWSLDCQDSTGKVVIKGEPKPLLKDTDGDGVIDSLDINNDGDGLPDTSDPEPDSSLNNGKPDWWCAKNPEKC